jgi:hypothetical protein
MKRTALLVGIAASVLATGAQAWAVDGSSVRWSVVEMSMKPRSDGSMPSWTVRIQADGAGVYSESGPADSKPVPLSVSAATLERVRTGEHAAKSGKCETRAKNIAQTGEKTIRYVDGERTSECTFNYSDDAGLMGALATFQAIAQTIQYGERLVHDLRYDRLGLDAEMDALVTEKQNGSAIEIGNIAPVLQALVEDDHVIDRVRRKAARLLQDSGAAVPSGFDSSDR